MKKGYRYTAFTLGLMFLIFAVLQYNDPDPEVWIAIYGATAFICFAVFRGWINLIVKGILLVAYIIGAVYLWPGTFEGITLDMGYKPEIEEARESLGLIICGLAMVFFLIVGRNKNS